MAPLGSVPLSNDMKRLKLLKSLESGNPDFFKKNESPGEFVMSNNMSKHVDVCVHEPSSNCKKLPKTAKNMSGKMTHVKPTYHNAPNHICQIARQKSTLTHLRSCAGCYVTIHVQFCFFGMLQPALQINTTVVVLILWSCCVFWVYLSPGL